MPFFIIPFLSNFVNTFYIILASFCFYKSAKNARIDKMTQIITVNPIEIIVGKNTIHHDIVMNPNIFKATNKTVK